MRCRSGLLLLLLPAAPLVLPVLERVAVGGVTLTLFVVVVVVVVGGGLAREAEAMEVASTGCFVAPLKSEGRSVLTLSGAPAPTAVAGVAGVELTVVVVAPPGLDTPVVAFGGGWPLPLLPVVRADEEPSGEEAPDVSGSAAVFFVPQREQNFAVGFMKAAPQFKQVGVADDIFFFGCCCCCYGRGVCLTTIMMDEVTAHYTTHYTFAASLLVQPPSSEMSFL